MPAGSAGTPVFDVLLDSALFHCFADATDQRRYVDAVTPLVKIGGRAVLLQFSDRNPDPWVGPVRVSAAQLRAVWSAAGWRVDTLDEDAKLHDVLGRNDGKGGHALLMTATRVEVHAHNFSEL